MPGKLVFLNNGRYLVQTLVCITGLVRQRSSGDFGVEGLLLTPRSRSPAYGIPRVMFVRHGMTRAPQEIRIRGQMETPHFHHALGLRYDSCCIYSSLQ